MRRTAAPLAATNASTAVACSSQRPENSASSTFPRRRRLPRRRPALFIRSRDVRRRSSLERMWRRGVARRCAERSQAATRPSRPRCRSSQMRCWKSEDDGATRAHCSSRSSKTQVRCSARLTRCRPTSAGRSSGRLVGDRLTLGYDTTSRCAPCKTDDRSPERGLLGGVGNGGDVRGHDDARVRRTLRVGVRECGAGRSRPAAGAYARSASATICAAAEGIGSRRSARSDERLHLPDCLTHRTRAYRHRTREAVIRPALRAVPRWSTLTDDAQE